MTCSMLVDQECIYGPYGANGETVCKFCGFTSAKIINKSIDDYKAQIERKHQEIQALAHRHCRVYKHGDSPADRIYTFDNFTLLNFARALLAKESGK